MVPGRTLSIKLITVLLVTCVYKNLVKGSEVKYIHVACNWPQETGHFDQKLQYWTMQSPRKLDI